MSPHSTSRSSNLIASRRKLAADVLKVCPLCGAVNARLNGECFVCRWHGGFSHDPMRIEAGVSDLLERCPELAEAILAPPAAQETTIASRLIQWWARVRRRRIDFRV